MLFWVLVSFLTACVAIALMLPLLRGEKGSAVAARGDVAVYRDQLAEIERDKASGLVAADEAERARAEIGRRLIAAVDAEASERRVRDTPRAGLLAQAAIVVLLPLLCLGLYISMGRPGLPDQPLAARLATPDGDIEVLIARVEAALVANPDDGAGWDVLAPVYARRGRLEDAVEAYRNALRILGDTPERLAGFAETLIAAADGQVVPAAREALQRALSLAPGDPGVRFYLALGLEQNGRADEARAAFADLAASAPANAPWLALVQSHLARLGTPTPTPQPAAPAGPSTADIAAAEDMQPADRKAMIEGMVSGLAARLKAQPADAEGWQRLMRSYMVLGRPDEARQALKDGLSHFPAKSEPGRQLLALAKTLGLVREGL
ncbi:c-type cytochrome biogenesis protein CcmI [Xaviernesmea oryzae]|uniref:C-type cytochrome biogenesis protein CcmI n=1 Tax=Xaviernesmea oryzae TaxID=464029 RepID=A0A1Q9B1H8_9HYPH|nr:c-type cytochrome biogenesis protein CcmI [Xaviernesmea oryzae]OLP61865.1 c-type cytochrome biogenesis protein CcmI [Xaviernesmea oryzae]SEL75000.1 cytochrome c-type biogenesis protein CcmH [Xaviernesmea oryzae]